MPATRTLTADGLPRIIADAALAIGWSPASRGPAPDGGMALTGRPPGAADGPAAEPPSTSVLHTYWVAG